MFVFNAEAEVILYGLLIFRGVSKQKAYDIVQRWLDEEILVCWNLETDEPVLTLADRRRVLR